MSQDSFMRKLNPMKLLDAGAQAISGAMRSGGSSVSDRISSLLRRDVETGSTTSVANHQEVAAAYALLRCTVTLADAAASVGAASFNIQLLDRRSNMPVVPQPVTRRWQECESVLAMITSLFPRLEGLPPPPPRPSAKSAAAINAEIEERRRYVQQCLSALFVHAGAAATRDLQRFLRFGGEDGLGTLAPNYKPSDAPAAAAASAFALTSANQPTASGRKMSQSFAPPTPLHAQQQSQSPRATTPGGGDASPAAAAAAPTSATAGPADDGPQHFDEGELIRDIFHLVDDDGSGYLDTEELEPFFSAIPKTVLTPQQIAKCLEESDKEQTGVIDIRNFRALCQQLTLAAKRPLLDIVRPFRSKHVATLYEALATVSSDPDPPPLDIDVDREEARVLLFVLMHVGLRSVTPAEVARHELALPISLPDFDGIMDAFLYSVSFNELLKSLGGKAAKGGDGAQSKTLKLVNRVAARAHPKAIKLLQERIAKAVPGSACAAALLAGMSRQASLQATAQCTSCDEMKKKLASLEEALAAATSNGSGSGRPHDTPSDDGALSPPLQSPAMSPKVSDMIRTQLDEAVTELEAAHRRVEELERALAESRAEVERLRASKLSSDAADPTSIGFTGGESFLAAAGGEFATTTLYLLPSNTPSAGMGGDGWRRGVIDCAGALTYEGFAPESDADVSDDDGDDAQPPPYRPMGWACDVYVVDAAGVEHMACRDRHGRRSIAWTIERRKLVCSWSRTVIGELPVGKWTRLTAQVHWDDKCVTWFLDGRVAVQRQPFRDVAADDVHTLDLYPRSTLVACYANMRFFK